MNERNSTGAKSRNEGHIDYISGLEVDSNHKLLTGTGKTNTGISATQMTSNSLRSNNSGKMHAPAILNS
jgi:hypothetical protein